MKQDLTECVPGDFDGVFTPLLTPWNEKGQVNEDELRKLVQWLISKGVRGLYPNGSAGEFVRLTPDERQRVVKAVCEEARGKALVLAGAGEPNIRETLEACATYAEWGARAVAVIAPFYYRVSPASVYAYYAALAKESPVDLTIYNIPAFASTIDVDTVRRLADFPRIVGIKDSTGDVASMIRMISTVRPHRPEFAFLAGWEAVFAPMLTIGCNGGVFASSNAVPEVLCAIHKSFRNDRLEEAIRIQYQLNPVFDAMLNCVEFPEGFRVATCSRGFDLRVGRLPMTENQKKTLAVRKQVISEAVAQLLAQQTSR